MNREDYGSIVLEYDRDNLVIKLSDIELLKEVRDFYDLLEEVLCNSDWELIGPEEVAALTESTIIGRGVERDDHGNLTDLLDIYWFPDYQIRSPLDVLRKDKEVTFNAG